MSNHATAEKPILIYRNSEEKCKENTIGLNQHGQQCTCPNNTTIKTNTNSPTTTPTTTTTTYLLKSNVTQMSPNTQMNVTQDSSSLLAPLCPTAPSLVKEEQLSYSWALITSPSANQQTDLNLENPHNHHNNNNNHLFTDMILDQDQPIVGEEEEEEPHHLGFIFHKPTSTTQRFLDGQPRIRRRRSTNQKRTTAANSTTVTPTNYNNRLPVNAITIDTFNDYNTPPSSTVSPPTHRMSISSTASSSAPTTGVMSHDPMDIQFDYLTEQLEILSNSHSSQHNHGFIGDLANADELTAILNNVLQKEEEDVSTMMTKAAGQQQQQQGIELNPSLPQSNVSTPVIPTLNSSHCGSFVPRTKCCKPMGSLGGESVVITITPLTKNDNTTNSMLMMLEEDPSQQKTTTRIVTCYCGNQCTCPGCLVHPGNFFLGTDPYSGLMINPSSSASSSCYGSDEEDLTSIYSKSNNPPFTF